MNAPRSRFTILRALFAPLHERAPRIPLWVPITCFVLAALTIAVGAIEFRDTSRSQRLGGFIGRFVIDLLYRAGGKGLVLGAFLFSAAALAGFGAYVLVRRRAARAAA